MENPFFIVGCERSGTTLLATLLDRHSEVAIPPESHFFVDVAPRKLQNKIKGHEAMTQRMSRCQRICDLGMAYHAVLKRFSTVEPTWANLLRTVLSMYAEQRGKTRYGEKTPAHLRDIPRIFEMLPESKAVCIVRDGRDVVQSLMKVAWAPHHNVRYHAESWRLAAVRAMKFRQRYPSRFMVVQYEQLLRDPPAIIKQIDDFLGLTFEPRQLDHSVKTGVVPGWEEKWKGNAGSALDPSRIGAWRAAFSDAQRWTLHRVMGRALKDFGYEVPAESPPILWRAREFFVDPISRFGFRKLYLRLQRRHRPPVQFKAANQLVPANHS